MDRLMHCRSQDYQLQMVMRLLFTIPLAILMPKACDISRSILAEAVKDA